MGIFNRKRSTTSAQNDWGDFNHPSLNYQKPKELQRFQAVAAFLASAALVFGLWSFGWYAMSALVKAEVDGWVEDQRAIGAVADFTEMQTSGFPSRIILTLSNPLYQGPAFGDVISWESDEITVMARPWTPWHLHIEAPGKHKLDIGDGTMSLSGAAQSLTADVVLGEHWPEELDLKIQGLSMNGSAPLSAGRFDLMAKHNPSAHGSETGLSLNLLGHDLIVPGGLPQPLGDHIQTLDLSARVLGAVHPGSLRDRLPGWRDSGGAVDVERLKFRGGPLGLTAGGTLALDQDLQPQGAFTAKIEGLFQIMEILRAKGLMRDGEAVVATMALSALSKRPKGGGAPSINVSVTVQDGELSLGPLKVMNMPHFEWGIPSTPSMPEPMPEPKEPPRDYKKGPVVY